MRNISVFVSFKLWLVVQDEISFKILLFLGLQAILFSEAEWFAQF